MLTAAAVGMSVPVPVPVPVSWSVPPLAVVHVPVPVPVPVPMPVPMHPATLAHDNRRDGWAPSHHRIASHHSVRGDHGARWEDMARRNGHRRAGHSRGEEPHPLLVLLPHGICLLGVALGGSRLRGPLLGIWARSAGCFRCSWFGAFLQRTRREGDGLHAFSARGRQRSRVRGVCVRER